MFTRLFVAAALVFAPVAESTPVLPKKPPAVFGVEEFSDGQLFIIAHHCDKYGGIDSIAFDAKGSGPFRLQWSNEKICGLQS